MEKTIFAERLREARQKANLKQNELAKKADISATTISSYEKGLKYPSFENAVKLAITLNVSLNWLSGIEKNDELQGKSDNEKTLEALIFIMKKYQYSFSPDYDGTVYLKFEFSHSDEIVKFFEEYDAIKQLKTTSSIVTAEMIETLEEKLIDKCRDFDLSQNKPKKKNNYNSNLPDDNDLPF